MASRQPWQGPSSQPIKGGLVQVFTGNGKGKTSAALGSVLRAVGHGLRVHIVYFMKSDYSCGENHALSQLSNVSFSRFGHQGFTDPRNVTQEDKEQARKALRAAREAVLSGDYDMVILDEVNVAVAWKLLEVEEVTGLISDKPERVELILTGRYADAKLIEQADLVTEMVKVKHPFDKGIKSRRGFDY